jgi:hypothetical protein
VPKEEAVANHNFFVVLFSFFFLKKKIFFFKFFFKIKNLIRCQISTFNWSMCQSVNSTNGQLME